MVATVQASHISAILPYNCRLNSFINIMKFLQQELIHESFWCLKIKVENNYSEKFKLSTLRLKSNKTI